MIDRATFYEWLQLEEIKEKLITAVEDSHYQEFVSCFYEYLATAVNEEKDWSELPWIKVRDLFYKAEEVNTPTKPFPILLHKSESKTSWDYEGRTWYFWLHTLASSYGWEIEQVKSLDIDDAIGLLQEILLDKYDDRNFLWRTSRVAYHTKSGRFQPLDKPNWMKAGIKIKKPPKQKIRKDFLPVGNVVHWKKDAES